MKEKVKQQLVEVVKMRDYLLMRGILLCFQKIEIGSHFQKLSFL